MLYCFFYLNNVTNIINATLGNGIRTNDRKRIKQLKLDSENIAKRIVKVYENNLDPKCKN